MIWIQRREFITLLGGAAAVAARGARAAAGDAGDWVPERASPRPMGIEAGAFRTGLNERATTKDET